MFLLTGHYQAIGVIPEGARNVQIKELSGFKNYLGKFIPVTKTDLGLTKHRRHCTDKFLLSITMGDVKMAGCWPSSFFARFWTKTESRSINSQKKRD